MGRGMVSLALLVACGSDPGKDPSATQTSPSTTTSEPSTAPTTDPTTDPTTESTTDTGVDVPDPGLAAAAAMYDPAHVARIDLVIDEADGDALALETNEIFDLLEGADCLDEPWSGPFNWYTADLVVDGVPVNEVGVRKKGLIGSLSTSKPSLKLDMDTYVEAQTLDGLERLTLNNSISDPSLVKQCLGYRLFRDAGLHAPRCSFATLSGNGEPLGVYVNVEPLKKNFLK